jgi:hypothetical protein
MEPSNTYRPRVSRETRLLLTAGIAALAVLWLLARIRFPERPVSPNPVPSVLSQLGGGRTFDDLAAEIEQLQRQVQPSLLLLEWRPAGDGAARQARPTAAVRLRDDLAITLVAPGSGREPGPDAALLAHDAASGLAVVRVSSWAPATAPAPWTPAQPKRSRYLVATDVAPDGVSLRPVFVGSLDPSENVAWAEPLWAVPAGTDLVPGSFLFTNGAELAGLAIAHGSGVAIVPAPALVAEANRLAATPPGPPGTIAVEVQDLTPPVAAVTGGATGVVVAWADPDGPGGDRVAVGDVIEAVDGVALAGRQHWDVRMARLSAGEVLTLRVRRRGELHDVAVTATAPSAGAAAGDADRPLGVVLRRRATVGTEIVRVEEASAAHGAGLMAGDVITLVGDTAAPTPAQVVRSFGSLAEGERVIVAVTRGAAHVVTALRR